MDANDLAVEARLQIVRRKRAEALRLHDRGEAVEARLEREETRERRAVNVDDAALDGRVLADVLVRLLPRDGLVGRNDDARDEENDEGQQRSHDLDPFRDGLL